MTCNGSVERNTIYVIFSPSEFAKANSINVDELQPQELSFEDFQKWLGKAKVRDKNMYVWKENLIMRK
jgi:hypothetical protein